MIETYNDIKLFNFEILNTIQMQVWLDLDLNCETK